MRTSYQSKPYRLLLKPILLLLMIYCCPSKVPARLKQQLPTGAGVVVHLFKTITAPDGVSRYVIAVGDTVDFATYPVLQKTYVAHGQLAETQINMSFKRISAWRIDFELAVRSKMLHLKQKDSAFLNQ